MTKIFARADTKTARQTLAIYWNEVRKDKRTFIIYTTLIPLNRLLYAVILPLIFSFVVQSLITDPYNWQHPTMLLAVAAVVAGVSLIMADNGFKRLFHHEEQIATQLTTRAMTALSRHSDQFFANRKVGSLASDVASFSHSIIGFGDMLFLQSSEIVVNFAASLIVIGFLSPALLPPLLIVTLLLVLTSVRASKRRGPLRARRKGHMTQLAGTVADVLGNQQIVRYFAQSNNEVANITAKRQQIESLARREVHMFQQDSILRQGVLFGFQIITLLVCVWLAAHNAITIAALVFAITYLGRLTAALHGITPIIRLSEQAMLDAETMTRILHEPLEVTDAPHAKPLVVTTGTIALDHVSFSYVDSKGSDIIKDITLSIPAGQRVGLAGHSGGGKTTLTKLLLRFADVTAGTITIDDQNIADVTQDSLRSQIAYVPQEPLLFHRSLRENIAYGKPNATDDEIWRAIKQANAGEFIADLPDGLDTVVGERGVKLSGGQRQRIAIARAVLKDAPILILDEATSALDSHSEKLIQDALKKLMKGRTSLVVAHRLSTIASLDRVIVIEKGRIAEDGSHAQLLKQKGTYAKLWSHQSGGFIDD